MNTNDYYTAKEAAKRLQVSKQRVHQLVKIYGLIVEKLGPLTMIPKKELRKIPRKRSCSTRIRDKSEKYFLTPGK